VPETIERIVEVYREHREDSERLIDTYRRIGMAPFKERIYAVRAAAA
jgi:sulfite reductase (NADPH) hemoprotein beta-component